MYLHNNLHGIARLHQPGPDVLSLLSTGYNSFRFTCSHV